MVKKFSDALVRRLVYPTTERSIAWEVPSSAGFQNCTTNFPIILTIFQ